MNNLLGVRSLSLTTLTFALAFTAAACGSDKDKSSQNGAEKAPATTTDEVPAQAPAAIAEDVPAQPPEAAPAGEEMGGVPLDGLGFQLEAPTSWTLRQVNENAYAFRIKGTKQGGAMVMSTLSVAKSPTMPASAEAAAKDCQGTLLETTTLDNGHFYFVCEQETAGQKIQNFDYFVATADGAIRCTGGGNDVTAILAACKTLMPLP